MPRQKLKWISIVKHTNSPLSVLCLPHGTKRSFFLLLRIYHQTNGIHLLTHSPTTPPATPKAEAKKSSICIEPALNETRVAFKSLRPQTNPLISSSDAANLDLKMPLLPNTIKFKDAQTEYWTAHTPLTKSSKVEKLSMLKKIAQDQENTGLHFEGRRSAAEVDLMTQHLTESSQAAQRQNLFSSFFNSGKALANDFYYYLEGNPSIDEIFDEFSKPAEQSNFKVRKSNSLIKKQKAGDPISNLGVGLIDSSHGSIEIQNGLTAFLKKNFDSGRGDIFLAEAVLVFETENGVEKVIRPSLEMHHSLICLGVPIQSCRILSEPEKEIEIVTTVIAERRKLVNQVFEFFMNAIPPSKAYDARQKLKNRSKVIRTVDTSFKLKLINEYQDFCNPDMQKRFERRIEFLEKVFKKQSAAEAVTQAARNQIYFSQISNAMKELKPGAKLYYSMGNTHFVDLNTKLNEIDGFFVDIMNPKVKDEL